MRIIKSALILVLNCFLLYSIVSLFHNPHDEDFNADQLFPFGKGNAPDQVRSEILARLARFQDGYALRDESQVTPFMEELFTANDLLILGTMPREIFVGYDQASGLVQSDWESWGDCRFLVDRAHVSSAGNLAWIATVGYVEFDLSRFLVMPLRLSGLLLKEGDVWRFQYMQFQFDLDLFWGLVIEIVLFVWLIVNVLSLLTNAYIRIRGKAVNSVDA